MSPEQFRDEFQPLPGLDYGWIVKFAQDEYARLADGFKQLDEKAAAVGSYLGAGTGLLTLGSVAAMASGQVSPWTVVLAAPSILLGLSALIAGVRARLTVRRPTPPPAVRAVAYAEHYHERGAAAFIGEWHLATVGALDALKLKARRVDLALHIFTAAIAALLIPLAFVVTVKFNDPKPTTPATIEPAKP
jgi:hypothetical protein